jgi:hypothetical protein
MYGAAAYPRKASHVFSSLSHPRRAAQLTAAGAVRERSPAITPIKNASTYGGMSFLLHQQEIAATFD